MPANFLRGTLMDERYSYKKVPGHAGLRRGRVSLSNTVYLITTTSENRESLLPTFLRPAQPRVVLKTPPCSEVAACWLGY